MEKAQKKSHLIKDGKIVVYTTDQYELTQLSLGRYGEIQINSVQGIGVQRYSRSLIFASVSDWYERMLILKHLNLHGQIRNKL